MTATVFLGEEWRSHPLSMFSDKYHEEQPEDKNLTRPVRKFYKKQNKLIRELESVVSLLDADDTARDEAVLTVQQQRQLIEKIKLFSKRAFVYWGYVYQLR
ncbi:unnamed protein product [Dibothriocephalus latus]|uniref:Uncharacterized protein n=1 Tax=Dibothriocephalus latus TaxID=60516 RepID=A0A3P7PBB4_DIBLA|nr:unnamed protein product [Dibothriocephalus latus]